MLRGYIGNADVLDRKGELRSRTGYLRSAIAKGYGLFAVVEKRLAKEEEPELVGLINQAVGPRINTDPDFDGVTALQRAFPDPRKALAYSGLSAAEIRESQPHELYDRLKVLARAKVRGGRS